MHVIWSCATFKYPVSKSCSQGFSFTLDAKIRHPRIPLGSPLIQLPFSSQKKGLSPRLWSKDAVNFFYGSIKWCQGKAGFYMWPHINAVLTANLLMDCGFVGSSGESISKISFLFFFLDNSLHNFKFFALSFHLPMCKAWQSKSTKYWRKNWS